MPGAGIEPARLAAPDFKSGMSTNFIIRAHHNAQISTHQEKWRRRPDSNRRRRLCRPLHNHFATPPLTLFYVYYSVESNLLN